MATFLNEFNILVHDLAANWLDIFGHLKKNIYIYIYLIEALSYSYFYDYSQVYVTLLYLNNFYVLGAQSSLQRSPIQKIITKGLNKDKVFALLFT